MVCFMRSVCRPFIFRALPLFAPKVQRVLALLALLLAFGRPNARADGTETITFEPAPLPHGDRLIDEWIEKDLRFTTPNRFGSNDVSDAGYPYNGSTYLNFAYTESPLTITTVDAQPFSVFTVDLAEYSTVFAEPKTITFVGTHVDGSTTSASFTLDGIIDGNGPARDFQTFTFPPAFRDLQKVTVDADIYSLDNLVVNVVPLPPVILGASSALAQSGQPFRYQIKATGSPTGYGVDGLPPGLSFDPATGLISGTPTSLGTYPVTLRATNAGGIGTANLQLTLTVAPTVSLTVATRTVQVGSGDIGLFILNLPEAQNHDVVVNYIIRGSAVNGTDYALLKGTKRIRAGKTNGLIKIIPRSDLGGVDKKTVVLSLLPGDGYVVGTGGKLKVKIFSK